MIRRPPRSTLDRSAAASDVYKRQVYQRAGERQQLIFSQGQMESLSTGMPKMGSEPFITRLEINANSGKIPIAVSYTHLRAHETVLDLVCRLLLEKKK